MRWELGFFSCLQDLGFQKQEVPVWEFPLQVLQCLGAGPPFGDFIEGLNNDQYYGSMFLV